MSNSGRAKRRSWMMALLVSFGAILETIGGAAAAPSESRTQSAAAEDDARSPEVPVKFRGVFFNPNVTHAGMSGYPWPVFDPYDTEYRRRSARRCGNWPPRPGSI